MRHLWLCLLLCWEAPMASRILFPHTSTPLVSCCASRFNLTGTDGSAVDSSNPLSGYFGMEKSPTEEFRHVAVMLSAVTSTLGVQQSSGPGAATRYFGTLVTTLESAKGQHTRESLNGIAFLLARIMPKLARPVISTSFERIVPLLLQVLAEQTGSAFITKNLLTCLFLFAKALEPSSLASKFGQHTVKALLVFSVDGRPKVRQHAQALVKSLMRSLHFRTVIIPSAGTSSTPASLPKVVCEVIVSFTQNELAKVTKRDFHLALYLCGLFQSIIFFLPIGPASMVLDQLQQIAQDSDPILNLQVLRVFASFFYQGMQPRKLKKDLFARAYKGKKGGKSGSPDPSDYVDDQFDDDDEHHGEDDENDSGSAHGSGVSATESAKRVEQEGKLVSTLLQVLFGMAPHHTEVETFKAFALALRLGVVRLHQLIPVQSRDRLLSAFTILADTAYLLSSRKEVVHASVNAIKEMINEVVDTAMVQQALAAATNTSKTSTSTSSSGKLVGISLSTSSEQSSQLAPLESLIVQAQSLLGIRYRDAWPLVLDILETIVASLDKDAAPLLTSMLTELDTLHRSTESRVLHVGVEKVIGRAIARCGPEAVVSVLPLQLPVPSQSVSVAEQLVSARAWMLTLFASHVQGSKLAIFTHELLPLAKIQLELAIAAENAVPSRKVEAKTCLSIAEQIWSCLSAFCNLPVDVVSSYKDLAKRLGAALQAPDTAFTQPVICKALRILIAKNLQIAEGRWGEDDFDVITRPKLADDDEDKATNKSSGKGGRNDDDPDEYEEDEDDAEEETKGSSSRKSQHNKNTKQQGKAKDEKADGDNDGEDDDEETTKVNVKADLASKKHMQPCPFTEDEAKANLKAIGAFARNFLPVMFNLASTTDPANRVIVLDCVAAYTRVAEDSVRATLFESALAKYVENTGAKMQAQRAAETAALQRLASKDQKKKAKKTAKSTSMSGMRGDDNDSDDDDDDDDDSDSDDGEDSDDDKTNHKRQNRPTVAERIEKKGKRAAKRERKAFADTARALADILLAMTPSLSPESVGRLVEAVAPQLNDEDVGLQKKAYQIFGHVADLKPDYYTSHWADMLNEVATSSATVLPGVARSRFQCLAKIFTNIPDVLSDDEEHESVRTFLPQLLGEALLGIKDTSSKAREAAYLFIVELCRNILDTTIVPVHGEEVMNSLIAEYILMIMAGLAGTTPLMKSATILALTRLVFTFRDRLPQTLTSNVLGSVIELMPTKSREILRALLTFLRVCCVALSPEYLQEHLQAIITGITSWTVDIKSRFKQRIRLMFTVLLKKFGTETIRKITPESDVRLVEHIRKTQEREAKQRAANKAAGNKSDASSASKMDDEEKALGLRKGGMSFDDVLNDTSDDDDDDSDGDDDKHLDAAQALQKRMNKLRESSGLSAQQKKDLKSMRASNGGDKQVYIHEDADFLDSSVAKHIATSKTDLRKMTGMDRSNDESKSTAVFTKSGKLDFKALENLMNEELHRGNKDGRHKQRDAKVAEKEALEAKQSRKREREEAQDAKAAAFRKSEGLGKKFASEKGAGDSIRGDQKYAPYAYVALDPRTLNKRKQGLSTEQFKEAFAPASAGGRQPGQAMTRTQRAAFRKKMFNTQTGGAQKKDRGQDSDDD